MADDNADFVFVDMLESDGSRASIQTDSLGDCLGFLLDFIYDEQAACFLDHYSFDIAYITRIELTISTLLNDREEGQAHKTGRGLDYPSVKLRHSWLTRNLTIQIQWYTSFVSVDLATIDANFISTSSEQYQWVLNEKEIESFQHLLPADAKSRLLESLASIPFSALLIEYVNGYD
ncbi:hypothetical protein I4U23_010422 [Adineta vaga]|nr:hypothetical protein I4U23_010422 [Adineta vaga]